MGNYIGFTKSGKVSVRQVWKALPEVLEARFPGVFEAMPLLGTGIKVLCKDCPDLQWEWWQDGNRVWGKYPRYGTVGFWVHNVILDEVGAKIGCKLISDGAKGTWLPQGGRDAAFRDYYLRATANMGHCDARSQMWLEHVKMLPPSLLPLAGPTGPLPEPGDTEK